MIPLMVTGIWCLKYAQQNHREPYDPEKDPTRQPATFNASPSEDIARLVEMCEEGKITEDEFEAFSEQFKKSTGKKAQEIIESISDLHDEYEEGAMSRGNYHAALWSLMDKLERNT